MGSAIGGSGSSDSSQQANSASNGFNSLPQSIQQAFSGLGTAVNNQILSPAGTSAFTPLAQTPDETNAYSMLEQGFAPTATSLNNNINMLMNPYNNSVINQLNTQANGQNSILKQAMNSAGQTNSNRGILGANDIDQNRIDQIGSFLNGQFNTDQNAALTTIPGLQQQDANNLLTVGSDQRNLATQTAQAPINAIMAAAQAMGVLPKVEGSSTSNSSGQSESQQSSGLLGPITGALHK